MFWKTVLTHQFPVAQNYAMGSEQAPAGLAPRARVDLMVACQTCRDSFPVRLSRIHTLCKVFKRRSHDTPSRKI